MHTLFCVIFALLTAAEFFTSWHVYATAAAGAGALSLLQYALQAGSLVASQISKSPLASEAAPMVTKAAQTVQ